VLQDCDTLLYFSAANAPLLSLNLSMCRLDAAALSSLLKRLGTASWPLLRELDLSFNRLDVMLVARMVQALSNNTGLRSLNLGGCNINPDGAAAIASFMASNTCIQHLLLPFNSVQVAGAEAFAETLLTNRTLLHLNLRQNGIGVVGGEALAECLRLNDTLKELCLADNNVGTEVAKLVVARCSGSVRDVMHSVRAAELLVPAIHEEKKKRGH